MSTSTFSDDDSSYRFWNGLYYIAVFDEKVFDNEFEFLFCMLYANLKISSWLLLFFCVHIKRWFRLHISWRRWVICSDFLVMASKFSFRQSMNSTKSLVSRLSLPISYNSFLRVTNFVTIFSTDLKDKYVLKMLLTIKLRYLLIAAFVKFSYVFSNCAIFSSVRPVILRKSLIKRTVLLSIFSTMPTVMSFLLLIMKVNLFILS